MLLVKVSSMSKLVYLNVPQLNQLFFLQQNKNHRAASLVQLDFDAPLAFLSPTHHYPQAWQLSTHCAYN